MPLFGPVSARNIRLPHTHRHARSRCWQTGALYPRRGASMTAPGTPLVEARKVDKTFDTRKGLFGRLIARRDYLVHALNSVSFGIARGETLGLIGESGCGKSTLARVVLRLQPPTAGQVFFEGEDI
ncbi:MAG: ABC transporter ATP-binding protein, partial [Betaproteobacteria bacterium]|nr:ABC transporter ATP-binding protein [Betaproteobacteria bacterium]